MSGSSSQRAVFAYGRTLRVVLLLLPFSASQAFAQAGGDGTGGNEYHRLKKATGNRNPTIQHKRRAKSGQAHSAPSTILSLGLDSFGDTLTVGDRGIVANLAALDTEWRSGGRLHLDAGGVNTNSQAVASAFQDTVNRRAFIESYVTIADKVEIAFQYDTSPIDFQPLQDAGISYRGPGPFMLSIGNFKEPMGFDQLASDNNTLFLERALPTALTPDRNTGALAGVNGERWTLVAGVWGGDPNTGLTDEGVSGTARATYAPILTAEQVLHLGLSGSYRELDRDSSQFAFESTATSPPETLLLPFNNAIVNTGAIAGATAIERVGLEAAYQYGSIRVQGEANLQTVVRVANSDATFSGGYAELGWVLNGDGRAYRLKPSYGSAYAEFGGVDVADDQRVSNGGFGVFEIGARASALDLSSGGISGGSERDLTLGINWYPERNLKLMGNYIHVDATPAMMATNHTQADILAGRLQLYW